MKSRVMVQVGDRRIEEDEHEIPPVGSAEALLLVEACGLCGSDVEQYRGTFAAKGIMRYPVIPGHEPIGRIAEIGKDAERMWGVKRGDRVALEPHLSCGRCELCLGGDYHNCRSLMPPGAPPCYGYTPRDVGHGLWGGYSEFMHLHERTILHKVPDTMPLALATLYQPIAAGIRWAVQVPKTEMGDTVLILGHGQRGLGAVIAAREAGASTIIVAGTSRSAHKLRLAEALGADFTIEADRENTVARVMEITSNRGVDVVLDVVPYFAHPIVDAVEVARIGGTVVLSGIKGKDEIVKLDVDRVIYKELTIKGVYSQARDAYVEAFRMLAENKYQLERLHTHEFTLDRAEEALQTLGRDQNTDEHPICVSLHPDTTTMAVGGTDKAQSGD
ncbi:alcohol dehydrogenase catalytic domain-containing protein [Alphaproteobacteria bacterium]|nr:alcohol dehydrogenase catalytic domain-containing protein [Alphaproteobacteria bacterium]